MPATVRGTSGLIAIFTSVVVAGQITAGAAAGTTTAAATTTIDATVGAPTHAVAMGTAGGATVVGMTGVVGGMGATPPVPLRVAMIGGVDVCSSLHPLPLTHAAYVRM